MSKEEKKPESVSRRSAIQTVGGVALGLAVGAAAGWLGKPTPAPEMVTLTETTTATVTETAIATATVAAPSVKPVTLPRLDGVELHINDMDNPYHYAVLQAIPKFEELTGVKIVIDKSAYEGLHEKVLLDLTSGAASYDIHCIDIVWIGEMGEGGFLAELTPLVERDKAEIALDDIAEPVWKGLGDWKGKQWCIPMFPLMFGYCYRKDLYEEYNIPKENWQPETWDEFYDLAKKFQGIDRNKDGKPDLWGTAFNVKRGPAIVDHWSQWFISFGGKFFKSFPELPFDYTPQLNGPEGFAATTFYKKLLDDAPPGNITYDWFDTAGALGQDKVAMVNQWMSGYEEDPGTSVVKGKVGYGLVPHSKEYGKPRIAFGGTAWGINKNSKNIEAAWTFMKWLIHPDTDAFLTNTGFWNPICTSNYSKYADKFPWFDAMAAAAPYCEYDSYRPRIPEYPKLQEILGLRLNQAMIGELGIQEALDTANKEITDVLKSTGKL